jgi:hypothetical protein
MKLENFKTDYDWRNVFGEENYTNPMPPNPEPPGSTVSIADFGIDNVVEVLAYDEGQPDEQDWICVVKLDDGRYASLWGGCDYTGWDWQGGSDSAVADNMGDIFMFGLEENQRERLMETLKLDIQNPEFGNTPFEDMVLHYTAKKHNN